MSYTITARVYQSNRNVFFYVVEKTVWNSANGGTWGENNGTHVLTMGGSGTCGSLRFASNTGEQFIITLGVHASKRWGDIVVNLTSEQTGVIITPQYYSNKDRSQQREKQLTTFDITNTQKRKIGFSYTVTEGNNLAVDITIG
ncbi:fungal fruit body lectin [Thelephora terrestris]|uniref:Fungal fruit body lectin n=1 Tax=Thelephora terrestris TaxID=56493 RepID=A0A9P6H2F4_9AGAM|nr:fungal fruit body lectin [Thelephora terrestris]